MIPSSAGDGDSPIDPKRRALVIGVGAGWSALCRAQTTNTAKVGWLLPGGVTPEDQARYEARMFKRLIIVASVVAFGLMVGGCSKCGFWWDEWQSWPRSCKGDIPK